MPENQRDEILSSLAETITSIQAGHPTRVAIEGRSAAGKSTFGDELAEAVRARGREVLRASIDDFHRVGHRDRSRQGGWTPQSYYDEGYDYDAFLDLLLRPLGPGGNRRCRIAFFDSFHNVLFPEEWHEVGDDTVVIIDGAFLLRPELAGHWDYVIWLDIDMETMVARARRRDVAWVGAGSEEIIERRYRQHWIPTHELYERLADPKARADAVIDNRIVDEPRLLRFSPG
jgi:uridine kinase